MSEIAEDGEDLVVDENIEEMKLLSPTTSRLIRRI